VYTVAYIGKYAPSPAGVGEILVDVIWVKKYEKRGKCERKKEEIGKKKEKLKLNSKINA
jgi:hypothetical protein